MRKLLGALLFIGAASVQAQDWPTRPVKVVVPYPAGGGHDFQARVVAQWLADNLKQPFVVENRSGASGTIGTDHVAKSAPDGYTFVVSSPAEIMVGAAAGMKVPYDWQKDLAPVTVIGETPLAIVLHPSVPAKSMKELVEYAKKNPGKLSYGTPGLGSTMQFAGESLKALGGIFIVHIPYRGAAPAVQDLLGGQTEMGIAGLPPVVGHHNAGRLRIVAVTSAKRAAALPDVPAVAELPGFSGYNFTNWTGVFMAAGTPPALIEKVAAAIGKATKDPAVREKLLKGGVEPLGIPTPEFVRFLQREDQTYSKIAKERGIKVQ